LSGEKKKASKRLRARRCCYNLAAWIVKVQNSTEVL